MKPHLSVILLLAISALSHALSLIPREQCAEATPVITMLRAHAIHYRRCWRKRA